MDKYGNSSYEYESVNYPPRILNAQQERSTDQYSDQPVLSGERSVSSRAYPNTNKIEHLENVIADKLRLINDLDSKLHITRTQ